MSDLGPVREMTLFEWVDKLPAGHVARKQYSDMLALIALGYLETIAIEDEPRLTAPGDDAPSQAVPEVEGLIKRLLSTLGELEQTKAQVETIRAETVAETREECAKLVDAKGWHLTARAIRALLPTYPMRKEE